MIISANGVYNFLDEQGTRPFTVTKTSDTTVSVTSGQCHFFGVWTTPTWEGGDSFGTDKTLGSGDTLYLKAEIAVGEGVVGSDGIKIGWGLTGGNLPAAEYDINFSSELITPNYTDGEVLITIANVTFDGGVITDIDQILDYNPLIPWNGGILTTITSGGTT